MAEEKKSEKAQESPRDNKKTQCPAGAPSWLVTFSDLVTLLLTFFVLLQSMSTINKVNFSTAASSLRTALTGKYSPAQTEFVVPVFPKVPKVDFAPIVEQSTEKVYEKIKSQIDSLRLNNDVGVLKRDDDSIVLRINDSVLFEAGQAKLSAPSYPVLRNVADIIRPLPMDLRIEGHTDDTPVPGSQFGNWDLSVSRSVAVLRFFTQSDLLNLDRMSSVGYGMERPAVPNTDEAGKAVNRRVDFVLRLKGNLSNDRTGTRSRAMPF